MLAKLLFGWALMALCVTLHAAAVTAALRWAEPRVEVDRGFVARAWLFVLLAGWMIFFHMVEIGAWAGGYLAIGALDDAHSAVYFSAVTYTTTGYGDVILERQYRVLGGIEALTGILMCGWSTGFFFAVVSRMESSWRRRQRP